MFQIITCSGTGATALLLATEIQRRESEWAASVGNIEVVAIACSLKSDQFYNSLQAYIDKNKILMGISGDHPFRLPTILDSSNCKWIPYGHLHKEIYQTWRYLEAQTDIAFDLTYAPSAWRQLLLHWKSCSHENTVDKYIYLHCGGVEGNTSQLSRYKRKWPSIVHYL